MWGWLVAFLLFGVLRVAASGDAAKQRHWAYEPIGKVEVPRSVAASGNPHPIDAFVQARLSKEGLKPAPEADRTTLIRRVTFDLTGLPPTPEEVRGFEQDTAPRAYERLVDRLLESPRHGERWARHWMDAVHFAETHGHDQDRIRTNAWPYRDWLIAAFNTDKPFVRFVEEQVAGDVLHPEDPQATVALGMVAAGPWDESSLRDIREDTLDRQIGRYVDRDDMVATVMNVFASTTVQCARCHDHKFDPISQQDYYALQAVFAGVERANRTYDTDPVVHRRRQSLLLRRRQVERGEAGLLLSEGATAEVGHWVDELRAHPLDWKPIPARVFLATGGSVLEQRADGSIFAGGARPDRDTYVVSTAPDALAGRTLTGIRLEVRADDALPKKGPGRQEQNGNLHLSEIVAELFVPGESKARRVRLARPTSDFDQEGWTIAHALDGNEKTAWGIHPEEGRSHEAAFEIDPPLAMPAGAVLSIQLRQLHGEGHLIGRFRLTVTESLGPVRIVPAAIASIAAVDPAARSEEQRRQIATYVLRENIRRGLDSLPQPSLVYAAAYEFEPDASLRASLTPRRVDILRRGEVTQPIAEARPGALECVRELPARFELPPGQEEGVRRAALARWLVARENPLVWRSIVNRVWLLHFGRGLVDTPNDFGRMGSAPTHPELLDWLAGWFRDEARGSMKQLHRMLVTSAAYRRSSSAGGGDAVARERDPENRLLWRMNRTRLDAECVRDAVLQLSGRLDLRMGGPGDMQFDLQPGIHVTPKVDYSKFDLDSDAGRRRSIYRFLFRTVPDPFMEALDCPAGDQLTPARNNSVTVQQALALWNGAFVARQAEHWAARVGAEGGSPEECAARAARWAWCREPTGEEKAGVGTYARNHGLPALCRLLINSNEFVFVD